MPNPKNPPPLQWGHYYHIYNRGVNRENIFIEARNYPYFLQLYAEHIVPIADTFAYCLLRNHFHFCIRTKDAPTFTPDRSPEDLSGVNVGVARAPSQAFSNFFNAYARTINNTYGRTGSLFQRPFGRKLITTNAYLTQLILYIHQNPQRHGLIDDFRDWPYSSYPALLGTKMTKIEREEVFSWYGGKDALRTAHMLHVELNAIAHLLDED